MGHGVLEAAASTPPVPDAFTRWNAGLLTLFSPHPPARRGCAETAAPRGEMSLRSERRAAKLRPPRRLQALLTPLALILFCGDCMGHTSHRGREVLV